MVKFSMCPKLAKVIHCFQHELFICEHVHVGSAEHALFNEVEKLTMSPGDDSIAGNTLPTPSVAMEGLSIVAPV